MLVWVQCVMIRELHHDFNYPRHFAVPSRQPIVYPGHRILAYSGPPCTFFGSNSNRSPFPCLSYKICRLIRRRVSRPKLTFFLKRPCFRSFCFSSRPYWCRRHILCPIPGIAARIPRLMNLSPRRPRRLFSLPILGPTVFLPLASIYLPTFH